MPFFILCILCLTVRTGLAEEPKNVKENITEILSQPEFQTTQDISRWKYIGGDDDDNNNEMVQLPKEESVAFIRQISEVIEVLLWILLGGGVIVLIIYIWRWLKPFLPQKKAQNDGIVSPLLSLDDFKNTLLPTKISQHAWTLWQDQQYALALSLLYRGAISVLIKRDHLKIDNSATDSECLYIIVSKQEVVLSTYFSVLSHAWQQIAYAGQIPNEIEFKRLCEDWTLYFGQTPTQKKLNIQN